MKSKLLPLLGGLVFCALFLVPSEVLAGGERNVTSDPVFEEYGNAWRPLNVNCSTTTLVLISTAATNSNLGIGAWRYREIVNTSNAQLVLYFDNTTYTTFTSTFSVVLGTGTFGMGDIYQTHSQGNIYGLWQNGISCTGGAGGHEDYWNGIRP